MCVFVCESYENSLLGDESQTGYVRQGMADVRNGVALLKVMSSGTVSLCGNSSYSM